MGSGATWRTAQIQGAATGHYAALQTSELMVREIEELLDSVAA
jgi:hypothetical protein